jgi:hypothetical protein
LVADEGAAGGEEGFVGVNSAVVAAGERPAAVPPRDRALDYPAALAEARAIGAASLGDPGCDTALPERVAMSLAVVGAVGEQRLEPELAVAACPRHPVDEQYELGDVVAVAAVSVTAKGNALAVADYVALGVRPAAVDRRGPVFGAPVGANVWTPASFQSRSPVGDDVLAVSNEQDARQHVGVGHLLATRIPTPPLHAGQNRSDPLPQSVTGHRVSQMDAVFEDSIPNSFCSAL